MPRHLPCHLPTFECFGSGTWTGSLHLPTRLTYCCPGLISLARDSTQDYKSLFTSINVEFFVAILSPVFLANLKIQLLSTEGFIHFSKSGLSSCFDVIECGDCLLVSQNHLVLLLGTWSRSLGGWYRAMEQNETDRHWSTPGGLAELGRSVQTAHFLLSFPWPLILEELVYMMVRKRPRHNMYDRTQQERAVQGVRAFTSWLHFIQALFKHLASLNLIESYEIVGGRGGGVRCMQEDGFMQKRKFASS